MRTQWTIDKVKEVANGCRNRRELQIKHVGAYKAAVRLGILNDLFATHTQIQWTDEMLRVEAAKYSSRSSFAKGSSSAYVTARQRGLLDSICPPRRGRSHTKESLTKLGKGFKTRTEFARRDPGAYSTAQRAGLLDDVCPANVGGVSQGETELLQFAKTLSADFKKQRFGNDYELDCYSPSLKIGIEYNGLYWHSDANPKMYKNYHLDKTRYFEKKAIRVIHIWENEWRNRNAQVRNYLQSACGVNTFRIGARKCVFKEIDANTAKVFLEATHIQGAPIQLTLSIGVYHKDILLAVAAFGKHHRDNTDLYVLNRFACLPGHTISGALAKASKMAYERLGPLKSWAHCCKSQGSGYLAAGWTIAKILAPDYFYTPKHGGIAISKQSRMKSRVKTPETMTEGEHAIKDGLHRVWDCGKILLIYNKG